MTRRLAALFRSLFPLLAAAAALGVLALAAAVWAQGGGAVRAAGVALFGLLAVVAAFGLVAVQVENAVLLRRIADALDAEGAADDPAEEEDAPAAAPPPVVRLGGRSEPPLRATGPALRPEPPLSRR